MTARPADERRAAALPAPAPVRDDGRIGLRTLVVIRWIAIAGQFTTVVVVHNWLGFELPIWPLLATIAASAVVNVLSLSQRRTRPRLPDRDAAFYLGFDTLQLALLLFLAGGLQNPFAALILAPLTVAATALSRVSVAALTGLVLVCVAGLAEYHMPLVWPGGTLEPHPLYALGVWVALSTAAIFMAVYVWSVAHEARRVSAALQATQGALAREQRLSALGALAAAAAHELGTPLGTIAVVAKEIAREIPADDPLSEDIRLLQSQVARCRDILAELARKPEADGGAPFDRLTARAMIEAAAAPHRIPGKTLEVAARGLEGIPEPVLARDPELVHGLGNLLQNALEFAASRVHALAEWDDVSLTISIADDGPGFPNQTLARIGEPYISTRSGRGAHMGLGIFIAQTLLERTGAAVSFRNRSEGGAEVVIRWTGTILKANETQED